MSRVHDSSDAAAAGFVPRSVSHSPAHVLVVDDELNIQRSLRLVLEGAGYAVTTCATASAGLAAIDVAPHAFSALLLDLAMPGMTGMELLTQLAARGLLADLPVIVISGHGTIDDAVRALRIGARDFLEKPIERTRLCTAVANAVEAHAARTALQAARAALARGLPELGPSAQMADLAREAARVAASSETVLISGEHGTGKEVLARRIHVLSSRAARPMVLVGCGALPRELVESELFGHEAGAFTGAISRKIGRFEQAEGGVLLLDGVDDLDLGAQAKLLRVLASGEVMPVGATVAHSVDVRVIATARTSLEAAVNAGTFRADLFYRLSVLTLAIAPLHVRPDDVRFHFTACLAQAAADHQTEPRTLTSAAWSELMGYGWPGNMRELRSICIRLTLFAECTEIDAAEVRATLGLAALPRAALASARARAADALPAATRAPETLIEHRTLAEREYLRGALAKHGWNVSRAALALGVERTNLHKKLRLHGLRRTADTDSVQDAPSSPEASSAAPLRAKPR